LFDRKSTSINAYVTVSFRQTRYKGRSADSDFKVKIITVIYTFLQIFGDILVKITLVYINEIYTNDGHSLEIILFTPIFILTYTGTVSRDFLYPVFHRSAPSGPIRDVLGPF